MLIKWRAVYGVVCLLFVCAGALSFSSQKVSADGLQCYASITPDSVSPSSSNDVYVTITNTESTDIRWIQVSRPSSNFSIAAAFVFAGGWNAASDNQSATFDGPGIMNGDSLSGQISVDVGPAESAAADWIVQASDDQSGSNPVSCTGPLGTSVSNQNPPSISGVAQSRLGSRGVTIEWNTDEPSTSQVRYGLTNIYGSTSTLSSRLTTDHSVQLSNLSPGTVYHYQVVSADGASNQRASTDSTFTTPAEAKGPGSGGATMSALTPLGTPIPIKAVPTEKTPPTITLQTDLSKPFKVAPSIQGTASDNEALAAVQYSTDGGKNWLPVEQSSGLGGKQATFSFRPISTQDGSYPILARAIDTSNNMSSTQLSTLTIDRLEPLAGGHIVSLGPQILSENTDGTITSALGIDQKITLSVVGGPTDITLNALSTEGRAKPQSFGLAKSDETGLWSGTLSFGTPGTYDLIARAVDGAGNRTSRSVGVVSVVTPARTVSRASDKPIASIVTVYSYESSAEGWLVWDGESYSQTNPQRTASDGNIKLFLPPGKYYLKAEAPGYRTLTSTIFQTTQSRPLSGDISLQPLPSVGIGSFRLTLPSFGEVRGLPAQDSSGRSKTNVAKATVQHPAVGKLLGDFSLRDTEGKVMRPANFLGRPTLFTFSATWAPTTNEQLQTLARLQPNKDINIMPVAVQEGTAKVRAYTAITNIQLRWLVDPDSTLSNNYGAPNMPTHYFVDRKGVVREVASGILTEKQILNGLGSL